MPTATVSHDFDAPPARVFSAISDIERFPEVNDDVLQVVFLTETRKGAGTRFRETRRMGRKQQDFELEVAEYDAAAMRFRAVCDADGVIWDTLMTVEVLGAVDATPRARLTLAMDAIAQSRGKRLMLRLFLPLFRRGMRKHLLALERHLASDPPDASAIAQSRS